MNSARNMADEIDNALHMADACQRFDVWAGRHSKDVGFPSAIAWLLAQRLITWNSDQGRLCTFSSGRVTTIRLPVNGIGTGLSRFGQFPALDVAVDRLGRRSGFAFHEIIHFLLA